MQAVSTSSRLPVDSIKTSVILVKASGKLNNLFINFLAGVSLRHREILWLRDRVSILWGLYFSNDLKYSLVYLGTLALRDQFVTVAIIRIAGGISSSFHLLSPPFNHTIH